jgi:hypothetical protein
MANRRWAGASGDWTNSTDWTGGKAPGAADAAIIDAPGTYTVTVTGPDAVGSVRLDDPGATLDITGTGTLSVSGSTVVQSGTLEIDPSGLLENGGTLTVKSGGTLNLNGTVQGGTLVIDHGGDLETSTTIPGVPGTLDNVTVLGGLTLNSGFFRLSGSTTVENASGTAPGVIRVEATAYLSLSAISSKVVLNGGYIYDSSLTIEKGALVRGYGGFFEGQEQASEVHNDGTINADVSGQSLSIGQSSGGLSSFVNDGLVLASHGGNLSVDNDDVDSSIDPWTNNADGVIRVVDGGTLQLGGKATNLGLIASINSNISFGNSTYQGGDAVTNAGQISVKGGEFFLGIANDTFNSWTDSGSIKTVSAATDIRGNGTIAVGGIFDINGGTVAGSGQVDDGGSIKLAGGTVTLASLSIDTGATFSGFGTVTDGLTNSGTISAEHGKLDLEAGVAGSGQIDIGKRATLELGGPTAEAVTFDGKHGTLLLDLANDFSGTVAGRAGHDNVD